MLETKKMQKKKDDITIPVKNINATAQLNHNSCQSCGSYRLLTRNHSPTGRLSLAEPIDRIQCATIQKPCTVFQRHLGNSYMHAMAGGRSPLIQTKNLSTTPAIQRQDVCCDHTLGFNEEEEEEEEELPKIQPKLTISAPNDIYEQEADRIAGQVIRMPDSDLEYEEDQPYADKKIQRASAKKSKDKEPDLNIHLNQSGGHPLSPSIRAFMEPRFGKNFAHVQLHNDQQAQKISSKINAKAFTYGHHIWLGKGTNENDHGLIAHELTHVIQQGKDKKENR